MIIKQVLPTIYKDSIIKLFNLIDSTRPDAVILLGYSKLADKPKIELVAQNHSSQTISDNAEQIGEKVIIPGNSEKLETTLLLGLITHVLDKIGLEYVISKDAGTFVCNFVYYQALNKLKDTKITCGLVHVRGESDSEFTEALKTVSAVLSLV